MVKAWMTGAAMAVIFVFVAAPVIVPLFWPMSFYYELRSVMVEDATEGKSPKVKVDRNIYRDFRGRYEIQILKLEGAEFTAFWACGEHRSPRRTYRVGATLPADMNLDWWMDIPPNRECPLPPGEYRIITTVYALLPFGGEVSAERSSNAFLIRPKRK